MRKELEFKVPNYMYVEKLLEKSFNGKVNIKNNNFEYNLYANENINKRILAYYITIKDWCELSTENIKLEKKENVIITAENEEMYKEFVKDGFTYDHILPPTYFKKIGNLELLDLVNWFMSKNTLKYSINKEEDGVLIKKEDNLSTETSYLLHDKNKNKFVYWYKNKESASINGFIVKEFEDGMKVIIE